MDNTNRSYRISVLDDQELEQIEQEYQQRKLRENLTGPITSTCVHVILLIFAAIFLKGTVEPGKPELAIQMATEVAPLQVPPPPPPPPPEMVPPEDSLSTDPVSSSAELVSANPSNALAALDDANPATDDKCALDMVSDVKNVISPTASRKLFGGSQTSGTGGGKRTGFGTPGQNMPGLKGVFYDCKQNPAGKQTAYASDNDAFINKVLRPFAQDWDAKILDRHYFRSKVLLFASEIFIPNCEAATAPQAFGLGDKVKPSRWIAHYKGQIQAPVSCKFRFWGLADDVMIVRWNQKTVIDSGWTVLSAPGTTSNFTNANGMEICGSKETRQGSKSPPFRASPWLTVESGVSYPMEVLISEIPGGYFGAWLLMEAWDDKEQKGTGKIALFKMSDENMKNLANDTGLEVDMTGDHFTWLVDKSGKNKPAPKTPENVISL